MSKLVRLVPTLFLALASAAFAADAVVYCQPEETGEIIDVLSDEGHACVGPLSAGGNGTACFTGKRKAAIDILNGPGVEAIFDGTDGEVVRDAHFKGKDSIAYTYFDSVNAYEEKMSMERCSKDFFSN